MRHLIARVLAVAVLAAVAVFAYFTLQAPQPPQVPTSVNVSKLIQEPKSIQPSIDFAFRSNQGRRIPVTLTRKTSAYELTWPDTSAHAWDTALLAVKVTTIQLPTAEGAVPAKSDESATDPYVEISSGSYRDRQYFGVGDQGPRWLNLSALHGVVAAGSAVTLRAEGITLSAGPSEIRLFDAKPDLNQPVLVLAPHPDDAEIAAFGLYATTQSTVVTVTAGNAGPATYEAVFGKDALVDQYRFKGRMRVIDSITVPLQGGVPPERALNLGYFDSRLRTMFETPDQATPEKYDSNTDIGQYRQYNVSRLAKKGARESNWRNLVADIETVLRQVNPSVIVAPHPQLDKHPDHQFTTVALVEALSRWHHNVTLLLYTNHADSNRYPYGPAGTLVSLPPLATQPVEIDGVYSLPVSPDLQRRKLFALESMHDLRYSPTKLYQSALGDGRITRPEVAGPDPDPGITYLRRGPRSNELFVVYNQDSVRPMIAAYLASRPVKPAAAP